MVYSSLLFIYGFLPITLLLYYIFPKKHREKLLLLFSLVFCAVQSLYFLIFISAYTLVNFAAGHLICRLRKKGSIAAIPLGIGIIIDITAIFAFRTEYLSWLQDVLRVPEGFFPVGISFFTLSAIGTLIDIYKGRIAADRSIIRYALYIMFFPRLIMGPIMRYEVFTNTLRSRREGLAEIGKGMTVFVRGLAKKVIAADNLYMLYKAAVSVDVSEMPALTAWLGITAYLLGLYFTLSGFADMGTGAGYCFGLRFPMSFNYPLFSAKIKYFAARWHSQVSQWIRRYITKPLYKTTRIMWLRELIFIGGWVVFGFWYGFGAGGMMWGALMGIALVIENRLTKIKLMNLTGIFLTFLVTVICTVFLSGDSLLYSAKYLLAMIGGGGSFADSHSFYLIRYYIVLLLITMYASTDLFRNMIRSRKNKIKTIASAVSPAVILVLLAVCTALISYSGSSGMILLRL